jgi:hypothetical protein
MPASFSGQIENRNFLSPVGFSFNLAKYPKVSFFCNAAKIPEITYPSLEQPNYLKQIPIPATKLEYGTLDLKFLIDENMVNYTTIYSWLIGVGFPKSSEQYAKFTAAGKNDAIPEGNMDIKKHFSDGTLSILNSNYNSTIKIKFTDLHPISLSSVEFDSTNPDLQYLTAEVSFDYTLYEFTNNNGEPL